MLPPRCPAVQGLLPRCPAVQGLLPRCPAVQGLLPRCPAVQGLLPRCPAVQALSVDSQPRPVVPLTQAAPRYVQAFCHNFTNSRLKSMKFNYRMYVYKFGVCTQYTSSIPDGCQLRRFALAYFHSHGDATGVFSQCIPGNCRLEAFRQPC